MSNQRKDDENDRPRFRAGDRVICGGDGWYYLLRGSEQLGPFSDKETAIYEGTIAASRKKNESESSQDLERLIKGKKIEMDFPVSSKGWDQVPEVKRSL